MRMCFCPSVSPMPLENEQALESPKLSERLSILHISREPFFGGPKVKGEASQGRIMLRQVCAISKKKAVKIEGQDHEVSTLCTCKCTKVANG